MVDTTLCEPSTNSFKNHNLWLLSLNASFFPFLPAPSSHSFFPFLLPAPGSTGWLIFVQAMMTMSLLASFGCLVCLSIVLMYYLVRYQVVTILTSFVLQAVSGKICSHSTVTSLSSKKGENFLRWYQESCRKKSIF